MIARSARSRHRRSPLVHAPALVAAATLAACGGSGGDDGGSGADPDGTDAPADGIDPNAGTASGETPSVDGGQPSTPLPGNIVRYGALNLGDEAGEASELVAGFFALSEGVAPEAFGAALDPSAAECRVTPGGSDPGFEAVSAGLLPAPEGVRATSIGAGETLVLSSAAGTWAELQPGGAVGGVSFYDLAPGTSLPEGPVPANLVLDVPGGDFPAFAAAALPTVAPLAGFAVDGDGATIGPDARFTWEPGGDAGAKVRLSSATNAGFFADDGGVTVACTVPDTGEFAFDAATREALGEGFEGTFPAASRIAVGTVAEGDALLILVRESEAVE